MDHPLSIFRSSSDADSDKDSRVTPPTKSSSYPSTPPALSSPSMPLTLPPVLCCLRRLRVRQRTRTPRRWRRRAAALCAWIPRWSCSTTAGTSAGCSASSSLATTRSTAARMRAGETAEVSSSSVDSSSKWHPQTLLQDVLRTRRRLSQSRLTVNFLIYFSGLVLTMVCGVAGACISPTTQSVTSIGALTIMSGLLTGAFNALSTVYTAWEQEVVAAQMTLNTRFPYIPIPYSPVPISFGMVSAATASTQKEATAATTKK